MRKPSRPKVQICCHLPMVASLGSRDPPWLSCSAPAQHECNCRACCLTSRSFLHAAKISPGRRGLELSSKSEAARPSAMPAPETAIIKQCSSIVRRGQYNGIKLAHLTGPCMHAEGLMGQCPPKTPLPVLHGQLVFHHQLVQQLCQILESIKLAMQIGRV